jgi:hypothetical protein
VRARAARYRFKLRRSHRRPITITTALANYISGTEKPCDTSRVCFRFADHVRRGCPRQLDFRGHVPGVLSGTPSAASRLQQLHTGEQRGSVVDR